MLLLEPSAKARCADRVAHLQALGVDACGLGWVDWRQSIAGGPTVQQFLGVRVLRLRKHLSQSPLLHQMAFFHHRHPIGEVAHQGQIVGNQEHGHARFFL